MNQPGMTFEEALAQLESVVERLESGELSLEESLRCFEEGVTLQRRCIADLTAAQRKIEILAEETAAPAIQAAAPVPRRIEPLFTVPATAE